VADYRAGLAAGRCPKRPMVPVASAPPAGGAGPDSASRTGGPDPAGCRRSDRTAHPGPDPAAAPPKEYMAQRCAQADQLAFDQAVIRPAMPRRSSPARCGSRAIRTQLGADRGALRRARDQRVQTWPWEIGAARAAMNYLVAQGIAADRITLISYGKERPVCARTAKPAGAEPARRVPGPRSLIGGQGDDIRGGFTDPHREPRSA